MSGHAWCNTPYVKRFMGRGREVYVYTCVKCDCEVSALPEILPGQPGFPQGPECDEIVVRRVMET